MKLYVCWGTFQVPGARRHPCRIAYEALVQAGHDPELVKAYGFGPLPDLTRGRREVRALTGQSWVPLLVTAQGGHVLGSEQIVEWARANPASGAAELAA